MAFALEPAAHLLYLSPLVVMVDWVMSLISPPAPLKHAIVFGISWWPIRP